MVKYAEKGKLYKLFDGYFINVSHIIMITLPVSVQMKFQ